MDEERKKLNVWIDADIARRVRVVAAQKDLSVSEIVRRLLTRYVETQEAK